VTDGDFFKRELEIFRQESEGAAQFYYAHLTVQTPE
jgi:hypothetical protein